VKNKLSPYLASLVVLAFLSVNAFAKDNHSGSFDLVDTARIGTTQLAPGHYKAEWSGPANDVKVAILQNGKTVATAEGHIKDLSERASYNAVVLKTLNNNTKTVDEIDFNNRTEVLKFPN